MRTALGDLPDRWWPDMRMSDAHEHLVRQRTGMSRRRFLQALGLGAGATLVGPALLRRPAFAGDVAANGLHVASGTDPTSTAIVSWSTAAPVANPQVAVGGSPVAAETVQVAGHPGRWYHHAPLSGLPAGSATTYEVLHDGSVARTATFTTAPSTATPFRFAAFGDMGATAAGATITGQIAAADPDYVFMVGDLCYADRLGGAVVPPDELGPPPFVQDLTQWDLWLAQIDAVASTTPWMTVVGNHEMEIGQGPLGYDGYRARMRMPAQGPGGSPLFVSRYANVAFVALDANDVSYEIPKNQGYLGTAQTDWLAARLGELRADPAVDFVVVGYHHCAYCSNTVHGSDGGVRDAFEALLDAHAVDLVVNGHNHSYERTHPLRGGEVRADAPVGATIRPATDGTVYVCAGGGGQAAYPSTLHPVSYVTNPLGVREPEAADWSAVRYLGDHSLLVVDVTPASASQPARMAVRAIGSAGNQVDAFTLER